MKTLKIFAFICMFHLVHPMKESMVKLKDNGYEDIVIAISPNIHENLQIIERIKSMLSDASTYMLHSTKNRVFIRKVKIVIPKTWSTNSQYGRPKTESFDGADVIIADPFYQGDEPYTLQYGGCGEKGKYIHFTPNFLLNDTLLHIYGPRGRLFVHEWAHLRWGVFDEYNFEQPYYLSTEGKVEATRCSLGINGMNKMLVPGTNDQVVDCQYSPETGLYDHNCMFIPYLNSPAKESIMYAQGLSHVKEFCDKDSHNSEAPNQQNKQCNQQSTWEVIMKSPDMTSTTPLTSTNIPPPVISLLQFKDRVVTLVLDISGSMNGYNRMDRMYQASEMYIMQIIETDSHLGIVVFSSAANIKSELVKITNKRQREHLKLLLPTASLGGTNICSGIQAGLQVNGRLDGSTHGTEIILLTDGEDSRISSCFPEVEASGVIIHTIALGTKADKALEQLATMTDGIKLYASDKVDANGLIAAFSGLVSSNGDVTQQSVQIESVTIPVNPGDCLDGIVIIDSTVGNDTFFLVTWDAGSPSITLTDPNGQVYGKSKFVSDPFSKSARLTIPGTAERGTWTYSICNTKTVKQVLGLTVNSRAADRNEPPIVAEAYMKEVSGIHGSPVVLYAIVTKGFSPILGASVIAEIGAEDGQIHKLDLLDNGAGADILRNDGIYSKFFIAYGKNGRYSLRVHIETTKNESKLGAQKNRAFYMPGFVENGDIKLKPPRPNIESYNVEHFSRKVSGDTFIISNVPSGTPSDRFEPYQITDLDAVIQGTQITLSWTATGDDLDQGNATGYDLRMSLSSQELLHHFVNTTAVNISNITPKPAGSKEIFTFTPEDIALTNGTIIYFALVAFDEINQQSKVSNLARVELFVPPSPEPKALKPLPDIYQPYQITDLDAVIQGTQITLTWTATVTRYDLRMSLSFEELLNNFMKATALNIPSTAPKPGGSKEMFTFTPENITLNNGTTIYFALVTFDAINQGLLNSNIARVTFFVPPSPKKSYFKSRIKSLLDSPFDF
ncbi:calcium-activated chloride channel regulator 1-like [Pelobates fuscus]|uniref:calcium-activated chloride channel regulator 1-like n=1 Tax=Pelobates fuscus TaxID=191477 RepID=UPI002FE48265